MVTVTNDVTETTDIARPRDQAVQHRLAQFITALPIILIALAVLIAILLTGPSVWIERIGDGAIFFTSGG